MSSLYRSAILIKAGLIVLHPNYFLAHLSKYYYLFIGLGLWCLTPLSTIFQFYWPAASHWQTLSHNVSSTPRLIFFFIHRKPNYFCVDSIRNLIVSCSNNILQLRKLRHILKRTRMKKQSNLTVMTIMNSGQLI